MNFNKKPEIPREPFGYKDAVEVYRGTKREKQRAEPTPAPLRRGVKIKLVNIEKKYKVPVEDLLKQLGYAIGIGGLDGLTGTQLKRLTAELDSAREMLKVGSWAGKTVLDPRFRPKNLGQDFKPVEEQVDKRGEIEENRSEQEKDWGRKTGVFSIQSEFAKRLFYYNSKEKLGWNKLLIGYRDSELYLVLLGENSRTEISFQDLKSQLKKTHIPDLVFTSRAEVETEEQFQTILVQELLAVLNKEFKIGIDPSAVKWAGELRFGNQKRRGIVRKQPNQFKFQRRTVLPQREGRTVLPQFPEKLKKIGFFQELFSLNGRVQGHNLRVLAPAGEDTVIHLYNPDGEQVASISLQELKRNLGGGFITYPRPDNPKIQKKFVKDLKKALAKNGLPALEVVL
ncbi:MAG: hypothetical protein AB1721_01240 [Patescibacteria group bacterium]